MTDPTPEFAEHLRSELCDSILVESSGDSAWAVATSLISGDGDALPIFVVNEGSRWRISDRGSGVSRLFFDDFEATGSRMGRIAKIVGEWGASISTDHEISLELDKPPGPYEVGDFQQLLAQVQAVALLSQEDREQTRYSTTVRRRVVESLTTPNFEENWTRPDLVGTRATYKADLWVETENASAIALFAASTTDKVNVSALSWSHLRTGGLQPLLAYHPDRVTSESVYRFQDEADDDMAVLPVSPGGVSALIRALGTRGVAVVSKS